MKQYFCYLTLAVLIIAITATASQDPILSSQLEILTLVSNYRNSLVSQAGELGMKPNMLVSRGNGTEIRGLDCDDADDFCKRCSQCFGETCALLLDGDIIAYIVCRELSSGLLAGLLGALGCTCIKC